jgi:hypothetical protein
MYSHRHSSRIGEMERGDKVIGETSDDLTTGPLPQKDRQDSNLHSSVSVVPSGIRHDSLKLKMGAAWNLCRIFGAKRETFDRFQLPR